MGVHGGHRSLGASVRLVGGEPAGLTRVLEPAKRAVSGLPLHARHHVHLAGEMSLGPSLMVAMAIGGSASILGSLLGGIHYVLVAQLANPVGANLTSLPQGAVVLFLLFVLHDGLVSLPSALTRGRRRSCAPAGPAAPPTTPPSTTGSGTAAEKPETERQGHA